MARRLTCYRSSVLKWSAFGLLASGVQQARSHRSISRSAYDDLRSRLSLFPRDQPRKIDYCSSPCQFAARYSTCSTTEGLPSFPPRIMVMNLDTKQLRLADFDSRCFSRGRNALVESLWLALQAMLISSSLPGSTHRRFLLRLFGANIGQGVCIKPGVRVKFPWRLVIGEHAWIGEDVWIDNLAEVTIGRNSCLSQGVYLCTGSHDWGSSTFELITKPIWIGEGAWIAAKAVIAPGVTVGQGAVLSLGSVATCDLEPWTIYQGVPAKPVASRHITK